MDLTTVCVTDRFETGWRYIQWSAVDHRTDHLQIFECGRKNSVLFSADKARTEPAQKAVWPQFLPQTNTEHAETADEKCSESKRPGAETVWKHAKRTRGRTHVSWGGRGRKFKSCHSDQIKPKTNRFRLYFLHFRGKIERFPTTFAPPEIPKIFWPHVWPQLEQRLLISAINYVIISLPNSKVLNVFGALRRWCSWKPFLRQLWYFAGRKSSMNKSAPKRHRGSPPSAMKYSVR